MGDGSMHRPPSGASREGNDTNARKDTLVVDTRGAVLTEYAVLVGLVAIVSMAAFMALAAATASGYGRAVALVLSPFP